MQIDETHRFAKQTFNLCEELYTLFRRLLACFNYTGSYLPRLLVQN